MLFQTSAWYARHMSHRWVKAKSGRAHLDIGERSSQSMRVRADHIIVTACRAHVDADSEQASLNDERLCSNCLRILRTMPLDEMAETSA
jgi:hypothetical protein